jgi:hypothetical protein
MVCFLVDTHNLYVSRSRNFVYLQSEHFEETGSRL